ncbi:amino acid adenylation domain-containing protein [Streptomyces nanhaiensis]|uniref:non-ribosomal peptide synthetase n=1 Tax=Streptomyces nanhaiensis TaxID=679319 RepID=UPI00399D24C8
MTEDLTTAARPSDAAYLLPASFGQRRLWLLQELEPGSGAAYIEHIAMRMRGPLDAGALRRSVDVLVERHETLRTALTLVGEEPMQAVEPELVVPMTRIDLTGDPGRLDEALRAYVSRPFDLGRAPLFRVALIRLAEDDHAFVAAFHHAVYDQWSGSVFMRELLTCYRAFTEGGEPGLPEPPIQYGDFAAWQNERTGSARERAELDHWTRRLWELPTLELPTDRPRPAVQAHRGATVTGELPGEVVRAVEELGRRTGATSFMTCLAAFGAVLHRWTGQDDIAVGTPVAGRDRPEVQDLIGFFVNNLVLRTDLAGDPTFERLLERVRGTCLDAYGHADVPFERLVERLAPERDLSRSPLFQVMFVFGNVPMPHTGLGDLRTEMLRTDPGTAKFDLFFALVPHGEGMRAVLEYDSALFERPTAERLLDHFRRLLTAAVADPGRRISELPLESEAEQRRLSEWGTGAARPAPVPPLPQQVARRAAAHPGRTAVTCGPRSLTYGELDERANRLAHHLVGAGIGAGALVAVALPRDADLLVTLLGVLKTGAAYVPVDPEHPAERVRFVLEDAGAAALITTEALRARLPEPGGPVVLVDADADTIAGRSPATPGAGPGLGDPAYVIYTSGSTGRPKGVVVPHGALANLLAAMADEPGCAEGDVLAAVTTLSFDIAALELYLPLVTGARVEIVPAGEATDGERLAARLEDCGATVLQATPTTWRLLLDAGWEAAGRPFTALCGGEAMPPDLAARLAAAVPAVWNMYGPTETTIWSTAHRVRGDEDPVPLGRPIAGTTLRVAGPDGRRRPVGVPGELWIGGAGLAHGYLHRPELTAERFTETSDGRWYRTGDLARYRADGTLEFLGRTDSQVKLRGFRIEPGEIESVLAAHPGVREAVAVVREDTPGDQRLTAYLVPETGAPRDLVEQARAHAAAALPAPMVPSAFAVLDALPLTPNRKIDRNRLPAPGDRGADRSSHTAPRSAAEREVAAVWSEVLGVERIGVHDDFFALGGHSLLAARAVSRLRTRLGIDLPVRALFQHPVLGDLAAALPRPGEPVHPVEPVPRLAESAGEHAGRLLLPASFQQRRIWFLQQLDPGSAAAYVMHGAQRLRGRLDTDALRRAAELLAHRHETLRTSFTVIGDEPVQVVHPEPAAVFELVDLGGAPRAGTSDPAAPETAAPDPAVPETAALDAVLRERARAPFDLAAPPLARITAVRLGPEDHVLQIVLHHAVSDRLTVDVLTRELAAAYTALLRGDRPELPELPVQYGDYAAWQQKWLEGPEPAAQIGHWRRRLDGLPVLDLPTDAPRPAAPTHEGATATADLPPRLVRRLEELAARHDATLFMVMLAGYAVLLSRWSGQEDFAIGSPVDSRTRPELENLVGYLTNNLVLRTDLSGDPTAAELLARVRETCLDAYAHADVPFEKLVEELRPERDLARSPLFQAMFIAVHLGAPGLALPGLTAEPLRPAAESAKYELTFTTYPHRGGQRVVAEYRSDLFAPATVARMLAQYATVLEQLADERPVNTIDPLPAAERALLEEWGNGPSLDIPQTGIPGLLRPHFEKYADRVAVSRGEDTLTYAELDHRANRLAHLLRAEGAGPGTLVAVFMERCPELMVALLGILRAGAAYVPMETNFPQERLRYILEDSGSVAVLTQEHLAGALPETSARVLCPDTGRPGTAAHPGTPPPGEPAPGDLAYVIYTSGSTGRPKGVALPHRPVVNFLLSMCDEPGMGPGDVVAAANTVSCDMPVLDLYLPLLHGARIEMVPLEEVTDGERLSARLAAAGVTYLQGTPTTWRVLQESGWTPPAGLVALAGAEKVPADLAHWLAGHGATVWHMYGPTETTVWSTVHRVAPGDDPLPLGHPVANTELLVLDQALRRTPVGVPGELHIGGDGLADGYLYRAELTAERFVADPRDPARRLYRTGDLVRYRADGTLEFLGRTDFQVKLRGFRVELGEIESVLRAHPAVRDAVVTVREDTAGDPRLVGYVVLAEESDRSALTAELDRDARAVLPAHMVPGALVVLEELPLTLNRNKVDRSRLPAPDGRRTGHGEYAAPRSGAEREVAAVWAEVLGVDRVGVHDDFFALGGHSLLATRLVTALRAATSAPFAVRTVFERPTVAAMAELLDGARGAGGDGTHGTHGTQGTDCADGGGEGTAIPVRRRGGGPYDILPASFQQRRVWFLDRLAPHSGGAYLMRGALRLRGALDTGALQRAVDTLVERHEALRTSFGAEDGEPVQHIARRAGLPVRHVDLAALPAEERERRLAALLEREGGHPFDLGRAPLLRVTLVRLAAEEHVLAVVSHHAVSDRLSTEILVTELTRAYEALVEGREPELPAPPVQYGDYAAWQQEWMAGERLDAEVAHWRRRLAGLPVLDLPTDRPRPAAQSYRGGTCSVPLPRALVDGLERLAAGEGGTLFMALLAAFGGMLHRLSGQDDLAVGTPDSGRGHLQLDGVVGYFANTLVLRSDASGDPAFRTLLHRVRETCLDAYEHTDVPFEKLVEELRPERDLARSPLFQVLFIMMPLPAPTLRLPGVEAEQMELAGTGAKFDLTLIVRPGADGEDWRLLLEYDGDLYEERTAELLLRRLLTLAHAAVTDPDTPLSRLPLLPDAERTDLRRWGSGPRRTVPGICVPQLFEAQAARVPGRVAVRHGAVRLTYAELNARANRLAHRLRGLGVGPGSLVALATERSPETFVGLMAVLKAGGAYVPVEPSHPAERVRSVLEGSGVALVLTTEESAARVPRCAARTLVLDGDPGEGHPQDDPVPSAGPDDPAYVIHTSGSTGRPKGVEISHGALAHLLAALGELGWIDENDRMAAPTTPAFDLSVPDLFLPLVTGACVDIVPPREASDGRALARRLREHGVTAMQATPTTWQLLLDAGWSPDGRFTAVCGGEPVPAALARRLAREGATVWHMYGPTEATVWATAHRVTGDETRLPLGRPLPNTVLRVADAQGRRCPAGVPGELWIGGPQLARGYLGSPGLTAERFVERDGVRWYRTGDIVRHRADGALEFVGRDDTQVKLRGFRVELGEIEAVLGDSPEVARAVAAVREDVPGDRRLVAYLVPAAPGALDDGGAAALRAAAERLPAHMLPSRAVVVDRLPLTPNRKVDRAALPAPGGHVPADEDHRPPRTPTEERLAAVLAEVLGVERVGVHDDFFALGGHSLLAARAHARIEAAWPDAPGVRALFEHPTVAGLATVLDAAGERPSGRPGPVGDPLGDAVLDDGIRPGPPGARPWPPRHTLLTGGTGFLGAFVLARLLAETDTTVHCLVRAEDGARARRRLVDHLTALRLWDPAWEDRLHAVAGDLAAPRLGLPEADFGELADRTDLIVHIGAVVNYALPYADLRDANVEGTREIIRLAARGEPTALHLVSSRAVFGRSRGGQTLREADVPTAPPYDDNGYALTKWTSEQLAHEAARRGLPVAVHRPGRVGGDSRTGLWRSDDVACHMMRACALVGMVPDTELATDLVPVDHLGTAIAALAVRQDALGQTFHYAGPAKAPLRLLAEALPDAGHPARLATPQEWYAAVRALADGAHDAGLDLVVQEYGQLADGRAADWREPEYDCAATARLLDGAVAFPHVDRALLARYLRAMNTTP